jgi:hypothetical protein
VKSPIQKITAGFFPRRIQSPKRGLRDYALLILKQQGGQVVGSYISRFVPISSFPDSLYLTGLFYLGIIEAGMVVG